jgi:hypothetical protein
MANLKIRFILHNGENYENPMYKFISLQNAKGAI